MNDERLDASGSPGNTSARQRYTVEERREIVAQLLRLGAEGRPLPEHVVAIARQYGVSRQTIYKWLSDPILKPGAPTPAANSHRRGFEVTVDMLAVVGNEQNRRTAWEKLTAAGIIDVGYSTFCRAISAADPALVAAALDGYKGMVNKRLYLKSVAPHRGWVYHLDHTQLDLWVAPSHKHTKRLVRPWVTVIVDGHSGLIWAFPWYTPVNGSMVAAALAYVCTRQNYQGVEIGGVPEQVVLDNAGEHFTAQMGAAATRLGLVLTPTNSHSSWQNGKAERTIKLLTERFAERAPGAINAGTTRTGSSRFLADVRDKTNLDGLWTATAFESALRHEVDAINTTIAMKRHGGLTRLQAWQRDTTQLRFITDVAARLVALPTDKDTYRGNKGGISFKGHNYVHADLHVGRKYKVRYLPTQSDFIEVFDTEDRHVCRAWRSDAMPTSERKKFMAARARVERDAKALEAGIQASRAHQAALDNENAADAGLADTMEPDWTVAAAEPVETLLGSLHGTDEERAHRISRPQRPRVSASPPEKTSPGPSLDFLRKHLGHLNADTRDEQT